MIRYIVSKELEVEESSYECDFVGTFDTEEEARQAAENLFNAMPDYEQQYYDVIVLKISADSLEVPDDWETFTEAKIIVTLSKDPEARWREMDEDEPKCDRDYVVHFCRSPLNDGIRVWIGDDPDMYVDQVLRGIPIETGFALKKWFEQYGEYIEENWEECFPGKLRKWYLDEITSRGHSAEEALEILQYLPQTCSELIDENVSKMIELWESKARVIVPYRTPLWKKMVLREQQDLWAKDIRSPRAERAWKEGWLQGRAKLIKLMCETGEMTYQEAMEELNIEAEDRKSILELIDTGKQA